MHGYLRSLGGLEMANRVSGYFKFEEHNVATHSFKVTQAARMLGDTEGQTGNGIDWCSLYEKVPNRDCIEWFIGNIKIPAKYATLKSRSMLTRVDRLLIENFIQSETPAESQTAYEQQFAEGKNGTLEDKIFAVANKIGLMYEPFGEVQKGNPKPACMDIHRPSLTAIMDFRDMASIQYFLKKILPELLKDNADGNAKNQLAIITTQIIQQ